jgi:hypothetical protein
MCHLTLIFRIEVNFLLQWFLLTFQLQDLHIGLHGALNFVVTYVNLGFYSVLY